MYLEMLSPNKYLFSQPQIKYLYGKMKIENKTKDHAVKDWLLLLVYYISFGTKRFELFAQYLSDILYNHKF